MDVAKAVPGLARLYLWHLDGAVRYAPALRLIRRHAKRRSRILEVGSGPVGITLFLPRPVTGCDVDFSGPDLGWLARVPASPGGTPLPFADGSFDFVLAMDVLEHVRPALRAWFVKELVRVAKTWLILSVPCGNEAEAYDARLYAWLKSRIGMDHRWLREHLELGLPEAGQVEALVRNCLPGDRRYDLEVLDNFNLDRWLWTWKFQVSRNRFWRSFKNKLLWPLAGRLSRQHRPPAYRKVFVLHNDPCATEARAA